MFACAILIREIAKTVDCYIQQIHTEGLDKWMVAQAACFVAAEKTGKPTDEDCVSIGHANMNIPTPPMNNKALLLGKELNL